MIEETRNVEVLMNRRHDRLTIKTEKKVKDFPISILASLEGTAMPES